MRKRRIIDFLIYSLTIFLCLVILTVLYFAPDSFVKVNSVYQGF